ncbi:heterokaryon incompatibility protein-domain-containing protein [Xylariaceae sp. FL0255]|nr:heterokaryon incompatibility protein-domain-containing protein [Xylariaceae sp. FL0255]
MRFRANSSTYKQPRKMQQYQGSRLERYQYEKLPDEGRNHIRIATLQPGTAGDAIQVIMRFERFDMNQKPDYEALSYAWGPPEADMAQIMIGHREPDSDKPLIRREYLGVRSNLLSALQQLRLKIKPRDVWIDALCIGQTDDIHKGTQVAMMGEIFGHASQVIIWLGPGSHESEHALGLIQDLGTQVDADWITGECKASSDAPNQDITILPNPSAPFTTNEVQTLEHLLRREWFGRLWV